LTWGPIRVVGKGAITSFRTERERSSMGVSNLSNNKRHSTFIWVQRSRMYTQVCDPSLIPSPTRPEQTNFRRGGR